MNAAILGAGIAGLACANRLVEAGIRVELFDKARGPGGRLATRRLDDGQVDLGAQYFTIRDEAFAERVMHWQRDGVVARWAPALVELRAGHARPVANCAERWVGTPRMSALTRHLATGLELHAQQAATAIEPRDDAWYVITPETRHGPFDRVVLAMPSPQAASLLRPAAPPLAAAVAARRMHGCWAAALAVQGTGPGYDAAFVDHPVLRWLARDAAKPGRPPGDTWVVHARADWSEHRLEAAPGDVLPDLVAAFRAATGLDDGVRGRVAHRWRYARGPDEPGPAFHLDAERGLAACGDWCGESRVESAWLSGDRLGKALAEEETEGSGRGSGF